MGLTAVGCTVKSVDGFLFLLPLQPGPKMAGASLRLRPSPIESHSPLLLPSLLMLVRNVR